MLFRKSLSDLTAADIQELITRQQQEDIETEFKRELATRDGTPDRWMTDQGSIGKFAKEALTKEIVAFANTQGGTIILGIVEDSDKRASHIVELPNCRALAERLGASIMSSTDPKITSLEAVGVPITGDAGVVVFRVPPSVRAPHRDKDTREAYRRRNDSSEPMDMREIQDLTLDRTRSIQRVMDRLLEGSGLPLGPDVWFRRDKDGVITGPHATYMSGGSMQSYALCSSRAVAVPIEPISLGDVFGQSHLRLPAIPLIQTDGKGGNPVRPSTRHADWTPTLRGMREGKDSPQTGKRHIRTINSDGRIVVDFRATEIHLNSDVRGIPSIWLLQPFAELLASAHLLRSRIGRPDLEFALLFEWFVPAKINILATTTMFYEPINMQSEYNVVSDYQLSSFDQVGQLFAELERDFWQATGEASLVGTFRYDFTASLKSLLP